MSEKRDWNVRLSEKNPGPRVRWIPYTDEEHQIPIKVEGVGSLNLSVNPKRDPIYNPTSVPVQVESRTFVCAFELETDTGNIRDGKVKVTFKLRLVDKITPF